MALIHFDKAIDYYIDGSDDDDKKFNAELHIILNNNKNRSHLLQIYEQWQVIKKKCPLESADDRLVVISKNKPFICAFKKIKLQHLIDNYINQKTNWIEAFFQIMDLCDLITYAYDVENKTEYKSIDNINSGNDNSNGILKHDTTNISQPCKSELKKNKNRIHKFYGSPQKIDKIRQQCNKYIYYIDQLNDKLYITRNDIDKYNIKLNSYLECKLMLQKNTNITMHQLYNIFIYYIKFKCIGDKRIYNNDKLIKDKELIQKLQVALDDLDYVADIELINEIHRYLHIVPAKRHQKTQYWCDCNYYDLKLNTDFNKNITKHFSASSDNL